MTTKDDIRQWFKRATKSHTHMLVVCDTFDHEDYPVFVNKDQQVRSVYDEYNDKNMQRVMEVYNLGLPLEPQLNEMRAFNF
jgi:CMP-N-acetylneuraminic acid synthetase